MEKETLLTGFNERLGNPDANGMYDQVGVSQRTLETYVDGLIPTITDDSEVNDTFWERHISFIKAVGGQMRHEKAEFAKNYKPKPSPAPSSTKTPPVPSATEGGELAALIKRLETLENERKEEKSAQTVKELRKRAKDHSETLGVSNKALWRDAVDQADCKEGTSLDDLTKAAKHIYERKLKEYFGEGAVPYGDMGNGGAGGANEEAAKTKREAFKKRMQSQGRLPRES